MRGDESFSHAAIIDLTDDASRAWRDRWCRYHRSMSSARRFPPPWSVEETAPCFIVRDANGQALAFVYCEDEPGRRATGKLLTRDEAGRIAANIAELPELLRRQPEI
jgi:hypothetical protein